VSEAMKVGPQARAGRELRVAISMPTMDGVPLKEIPGLARMAEDAGLHSAWTGEFFHHDGYVILTSMALATQKITVGSSISYAFMRSPTLTAAAAMDIDELSGGRFILGLGTGTRTMQEDWYSIPYEPVAAKLKETIQLIRYLWSCQKGKPARFEGRFYKINIPQYARPHAVREQIPIYTAAVNRLMLRTAGEAADGLVGHPLYSRRYLKEVVIPTVEEGLGRSGRRREDFTLTSLVITVVNKDRQMARRIAKYQIAQYSAVKTYGAILDLHGWEEEKAKAQAALRSWDLERMADSVSEEMVDAIAVAGTPDECRRRLREYDGLLDLPLLMGPYNGVPIDVALENYRAIVETFGR